MMRVCGRKEDVLLDRQCCAYDMERGREYGGVDKYLGLKCYSEKLPLTVKYLLVLWQGFLRRFLW